MPLTARPAVDPVAPGRSIESMRTDAARLGWTPREYPDGWNMVRLAADGQPARLWGRGFPSLIEALGNATDLPDATATACRMVGFDECGMPNA